jgi:hypothetical protein
LNLCGQANKDIIDCYSPAQVVKAKEYQREKEALAAVEEPECLQGGTFKEKNHSLKEANTSVCLLIYTNTPIQINS